MRVKREGESPASLRSKSCDTQCHSHMNRGDQLKRSLLCNLNQGLRNSPTTGEQYYGPRDFCFANCHHGASDSISNANNLPILASLVQYNIARFACPATRAHKTQSKPQRGFAARLRLLHPLKVQVGAGGMYWVISAWYQGVVTGDKTADLAGVVVGWGTGLCSRIQEVVWGLCLEAFLRKNKEDNEILLEGRRQLTSVCDSSLAF
ncbi:hypothetical protein BKA66DRAFT_40640 [Pyrenochaeta sp. MPI-SDFR-AT-0127]|nr:hypothetical protein BKA66DRAFT_40640 [Pyrenochaeta sp. MPI-SDFR-AT-0127]